MTQPSAIRHAVPSHARQLWRRGLTIALAAIGLGVVAAAAGAPSTRAAEAVPSPTPDPNVQVWLDQPLLPDVPAGRKVTIGFMIWDLRVNAPSRISNPYVRLHPRTGSAPATIGKAHSDFPGHLLVDLVVPNGGPGEVEVGIQDPACTVSGICAVADFPFVNGGIGPPPNAPRTGLVVGIVHPFPASIVAGSTFRLTVDLVARAEWDPTLLALPDHLVAVVNAGRGGDLANAELQRESGSDSTYSGDITVPTDGQMTLRVLIAGNGTEDLPVDSTTTRFAVLPGANRSAAPSEAASPSGSSVTTGTNLPILPIAVVIAVIALGLVIRRTFADL